ncbi:NAD(P)-dependent oxidoreductase [Hamadaea tsunoensis]|uniref:NAD(P)-dependent oxidoreductase n=1 Tax=Hamadaea tsunoensis TaxID=53368 RepID=UPI0004081E0E|nr:NAD(P)H-binding protein [Hamadaea tsunoensis]
MRIAVIGAAGNLGNVVAHEARTRGHEVTALGRADVDVTDAASVKESVAGHDAVVVAIKGPEQTVSRGAQALLEALPAAGVDRLVFLGGGGSLLTPSGQRFVDSPAFPPQYLETAMDQAAALDILRTSQTDLVWSYVSPPPVHLIPGDKTGTYRTEAGDTPLIDAGGESRISTGDYASAVLDVMEQDLFPQQRFTVAY